MMSSSTNRTLFMSPTIRDYGSDNAIKSSEAGVMDQL
jgi:hypothetical protein